MADVVAVFIAGLSLLVAVYAARLSRENAILEISQTLHSNLLSDKKSIGLFYRISSNELDYHFDARAVGEKGNFLGSEDEEDVDIFLEKLNFICFLLLDGDVGVAGKIFESYIRKSLSAKFTREYLKFMSDDPARGDEEHYPFLRRYATERLKLDLEAVSYRKGPRA